MKRLLKGIIGTTLLTVILLSMTAERSQAQPGVSVSFQMFYDELSPYGQWIDDPDYGYVWAPQVDDGFRPYYSGGRWAMTDYGNTWVSDYDWGWAPFHYGRWTYDNFYGWVWIPGNEWGPAWVDWRSGGGYYGWAPLGPSITIGSSWFAPVDWWVFIPNRYIYSPNYYSYWRGPGYNTTIINNTTVINNYYNNRYAYGPRRNDIERYTGQRVNVYNIRNERRPQRTSIRGNDVAIYRPQVSRASLRSEAPRNAVRADRPIGSRDDRRTMDRAGNMDRNERVAGSRQMQSQDRAQAQRQAPNYDRQQQMDRPTADRNQSQERPGMQSERFGLNQRAESDPYQRRATGRQNFDRNQITERENTQRQQAERQRSEQQNMQRLQQERGTQEQMQRQQMERQRAEQQNRQRMQQERGRQEQMQRQQMERQRAEQQNMQRMQMERGRQEQMQRQQVERQRAEQQSMQRRQMERGRQEQQRSAPSQREWRRPEPQRMERPQPQRMERPQPQRMERAQPQRMERSMPSMDRGGARQDRGDRGRR